MFRRKNTILGLDIGTSSIKAIEMTSTGGDFCITGYGQVAITNPENPLDDIKELLQTSGIKSKRAIIGVSGREVIVRYISIQAVDKENLADAVRLEADKYIPYDLEEVVLDSQRLDDDAEINTSGEMKVLLVAAKRSLIDSRVDVLRNSELHPSIIDVDSFALGNAFVLKSMLSHRAEVEGKVVSLVDIGCTKTNINIMIGNISFFTREIYLAGNEFTDEIHKKLEVTTDEAEGLKREPGIFALEVQEAVAPVIDDLANEISLSFEYFESQFTRQVEEIYVSGGGSQLFSLEPDFERIFGKRINRWDPTENFEVREDQVDVDALKANASQLAIAIGLASRIYENKV